jgi:tetratricopeptide (TPR) repeat protein
MSTDDSQEGEFERLLKAFRSAQESGDFEQAEFIGVQCLVFAAEEAERNPSESLRVAQEAHEHEAAARWEQAEAAHRRALALAQAEGNEAMIFKAHDDLRSLYAICGTADKALQEAQAALEAARKTDMAPVLLMALGGLFQCHLMKGELTSAAAAAEEAIQITPAEKMYDGQRARALLMRARCRLEQGQVSQAEQDLEGAWRILAPQAKAAMLAGVQGSLAVWWEITARIRTQSKEFAAAAQAMGKAVEFRRIVSQLPQLEGPHKQYALARVLQDYSVALLAEGKVEAANAAFKESRNIQQETGIAIPLAGTV